MTDLLDAPPVLAPGPRVSGPASAAVRLKQLRAAFVSRSQQVNMAHNSYKCLSKHNDVSAPLLSLCFSCSSPDPLLYAQTYRRPPAVRPWSLYHWTRTIRERASWYEYRRTW